MSYITIDPVQVADALLLQTNMDADAAEAKTSVTDLCEKIHCYVNEEGTQHGAETMELLNQIVSELSGTCHKNTDKAIKCLNATLNRIGKRTGEESQYNGRYLKIPTKRGKWQGAISKLIAESKAKTVKQLLEAATALRKDMDGFQKEFEGVSGVSEVLDIIENMITNPDDIVPEVTTLIEKNVIAFDVHRAA
jgi:hypothetical protein